VLVRQRGALFEAIIRALKQAGIPVAGADRLTLTEHIAVMDLMALADALLLPSDDLALASVLKSPLFGLTEEQLFALAVARKARCARRLRRANDLEFMDAQARLERYAEWARHLSPFAFYARILGPRAAGARSMRGSGRRPPTRSTSFLEHALIYERERGADSAGLRRVAARRRHAGEARHGHRARRSARDDGAWRQGPGGADRDPRRHHDAAEGARASRGCFASPCERRARHAGPLVWARRKADDVAPVAAARAVAGAARRGRIPPAALCGDDARGRPAGVAGRAASTACRTAAGTADRDRAEGRAIEVPADDGDGRCGAGASRRTRRSRRRAASAPPAAQHDVPDWLRAMRLPRPRPRARFARSSAGRRAACAALPSAPRARAHRAPPVAGAARRAPERRRGGARTSRRATDFSEAERDGIVREVCASDDARFASLFAGSRAEVPIVGYVSHGTGLGQVDRLAVTASEVLIADYKSDRTRTGATSTTFSRP
jgi:ATP-dependent helicase/nuclease subunit A